LASFQKAAFTHCGAGFILTVADQRLELPNLIHRGFLELMRYRSGALLTRSNDLNFI
jgi:hypothetical protein